jgi:hypothetical protein
MREPGEARRTANMSGQASFNPAHPLRVSGKLGSVCARVREPAQQFFRISCRSGYVPLHASGLRLSHWSRHFHPGAVRAAIYRPASRIAQASVGRTVGQDAWPQSTTIAKACSLGEQCRGGHAIEVALSL